MRWRAGLKTRSSIRTSPSRRPRRRSAIARRSWPAPPGGDAIRHAAAAQRSDSGVAACARSVVPRSTPSSPPRRAAGRHVAGRYSACAHRSAELLQVEPACCCHRWLQACAGDAFQATFNTASCRIARADAARRRRRRFDGESDGDDDGSVRIESPLVSLRATKAMCLAMVGY